MSLDFSKIKAITIPEGSVKKITDSQGNVLWEKPQQAQWHTIWEGSRDIGVYNGTARGAGTNFAQCANDTGYTPLIRITFSNLTATSNDNVNANYTINNVGSKSKPYSPQEMTLKGYTSYTVFGVSATNKYFYNSCSGKITAKKDTSNNRITFDAETYRGDSYTAYFTLKKIEQYY